LVDLWFRRTIMMAARDGATRTRKGPGIGRGLITNTVASD
jgi:hypothetical protein